MTRPYVKSGFPDEGQIRFPEQIKESGRFMGLTGTAAIWDRIRTDDGGGAPIDTWVDRVPVRARLDPIGRRGSGLLTGEAIDETSTHVITFDDGTDVSTANRVFMEDRLWGVTVKGTQTDELVVQVEARELVTSA